MARARIAVGDVVALGPGAPVRAAYELSKRAGGHRLVFGGLAALSVRRAGGPVIPAHGGSRSAHPLADAPPVAVTRTIAAAERIADGAIPVFGTTLAAGGTPPWHDALDGTGTTWTVAPWWTIDIRSGERAADVKLSWELNRQRHLVVLARAAGVEPEAGHAEALARHLTSWLDVNPLEHGVQWYSNLEIALRSLAWLEVLDHASDLLPRPLVGRMEAVLVHAGRHLLADLPYTLSTMRNNHLLGDALALEVLAARGLAGRLAATVGRRLFCDQMARHMRPDGSMVEDSLSYHRFVLEMLAVRVRHGLADASTLEAMVGAAQVLARLGVLDGPVPQYGDWDEGRVLTATGAPDDLGGSVQLALALGGSGAPEAWADAYDEVAWYSRRGEPVAGDPAEVDGHEAGAGIARARRGPFTTWLKMGGGSSHGHADRGSTPILWQGRWLVGDPGTGTYNGPIAERNHFRTSIAHSVLRIDDEDQLVPHRAFRWRNGAEGVVGAPLRAGGSVVSWGAHDAYRRIGAGRIARAVVTDADGVVVVDWVEHAHGRAWALSLPLAPDVDFDTATSTLRTDAGDIRLHLPGPPTARCGRTEPFDGWWSDTYDERRPATRLEVTGTVGGPVVWSVGDLTGRATTEGPIEVAGTTLDVRWHDTAIELLLDDGATSSAFCELPR